MQTVDFFTPIVDDPFVYGQIAAANALSDVYAMGGRPLTALAIAGVSRRRSTRRCSRQIFAGGLDKLREAGVALLGGHTVQDQEIKFGYAVTGEVDPAPVLGERRRAARRRADPDQAARHRRHRDGAQVRPGAGRRGRRRRCDRWSTLNRAAVRGAASAAAGRRARLHRHHRLRPGRPRRGDGRSRAACRLVIDSRRGAAARGRRWTLVDGNVPGRRRDQPGALSGTLASAGPASSRAGRPVPRPADLRRLARGDRARACGAAGRRGGRRRRGVSASIGARQVGSASSAADAGDADVVRFGRAHRDARPRRSPKPSADPVLAGLAWQPGTSNGIN